MLFCLDKMPKETLKTCHICGEAFSKRYIQRHETDCQLKYRNQEDLNQSFNELDMSILDGLGTTTNCDTNTIDCDIRENDMAVDNENESSLEDMYSDNDLIEEDFYSDDEDFEELLSNLDLGNNEESSSLNPKQSAMVVTWICFFFAFWQYTFGITDTAMEVMIKFMYALLSLISKTVPQAEYLFAGMPPTLYLFLKHFKKNNTDDTFIKYVVCVKCFALYRYEDCYTKIQNVEVSKRCKHIAIPNHNQAFRRQQCGQELLMTVKSKDGRSCLKPFKTFCYMPLENSIKKLLQRRGIEEQSQLWKERETRPGVMTDIYDGKVWKENIEYLKEDNTFGIAINLDWFCPYKHVRSYSIGAIYGVLLNLPRSERFIRKNMFLIGIIPNMKKEPPTNTFIEPMVQDLLNSWNGQMKLTTYNSPAQKKAIKLMLLLVGCDIPACRKLCGFLGRAFSSVFLIDSCLIIFYTRGHALTLSH